MASATWNARGIKGRLRSATSILSSPEPLPAYGVAGSGDVSGTSNGKEEDGFPLPENAMDREYKTFLNNLTVHGKSYLLEIWMGNPLRLIRLKYEVQGSDEGTGCSYAINTRTRSGSNKIADAEELFESRKRMKQDRTTLCLSKSGCFEKKYETVDENKQEEEGKEEMEREEEQEERVKVNQELLDEYEDLLRKSSASSTHTLAQDSRISVITAHRSYIETLRKRAPTFFRNKLIDAISSPFSQSEYENLIVQARKRSPQVKLKHLRCDSVPYKTKILGSSYFDYFPDLAKEVEHADCYKGLALMRGFFFWLKNLGHDGAFMPWFPHL